MNPEPQQHVSLSLLERPYADRQMIVVAADAVVTATRSAERAENRTNIAEFVWDTLIPGRAVAKAIQAWARARARGMQILLVSKSEVAHIAFPPGHPRDKVLYVGHPATPYVYYTIADFHRVTFDHKFAEAVNLLMYLGATQIRVERVRGWSKEFSAGVFAPLGDMGATVGAGVETKQTTDTQLLYEATLPGGKEPKLPDSLVWYPHEPTWQSIAKGRLKFGLQSFSLNVAYEDDFGVNGDLKIAAGKADLGLGGRFENHLATTWRITGEFAPQP